MNGTQIDVERNGERRSRPPVFLVGSAVVVTFVLAATIVAGGFGGSLDFTRTVSTTEASPSPSTTVTTTLDRYVDHITVEDFDSDMIWSEISLPPWFDVIIAIGRFGGDLAVIGGQVRGDGEVVHTSFSRWTGSWEKPVILTRGNEVLRTAAISADAIVAVVWDGIGRDVGEASVLWSTDGDLFQRQILDPGPPDGTILDIAYVTTHGTEAWLFGSTRTSGWSHVMDQFSESVVDLVARGDARVIRGEGAVTISLRGGRTIAQYSFEALGTSAAALERSERPVSVVLHSDLDGGGFEMSFDAVGGGALVDSAGVLVGMETAAFEWLSEIVGLAAVDASQALAAGDPIDGVPESVADGVMFLAGSVIPRIHALSADFDFIIDFDVDATFRKGVGPDPFLTGLILPVIASEPVGFVTVGAPNRVVAARGQRVEFTAGGDVMLHVDDELAGQEAKDSGGSALSMRLEITVDDELHMLGPDGTVYATLAVDDIGFPAQVVVPAGAAGVILSGRSGGFELHWFTDVFGAPTATSYDGTTAYVALGPGLGIAGSSFRATIWIGTFDD